jgi:hypothetical protein
VKHEEFKERFLDSIRTGLVESLNTAEQDSLKTVLQSLLMQKVFRHLVIEQAELMTEIAGMRFFGPDDEIAKAVQAQGVVNGISRALEILLDLTETPEEEEEEEDA